MNLKIQEEKDKLKHEIALSKRLFLKNVTSVSINPLNKKSISSGIIEYIGSNPIQTLYLADKVTNTLLSEDHKINKTIKGIRRGVEVVDELLM
ncbi:MAG: hypothetical protein HKN68_10635 [Saprospiraceae bacterium]|nr:hypothetical protein [Saprospiraceae bacterium]